MKRINGSDLAGKRFMVLKNGDLREMKGKFVPGINEKYCFITAHGNVACAVYQADEMDDWAIKHHPIFRTEEEAEEYEHYLETLDEYTFKPDWDGEEQEKYEICYGHRYKGIFISSPRTSVQSAVSYFPSLSDAETFIAEVGEDAVKRFMFDVWD